MEVCVIWCIAAFFWLVMFSGSRLVFLETGHGNTRQYVLGRYQCLICYATYLRPLQLSVNNALNRGMHEMLGMCQRLGVGSATWVLTGVLNHVRGIGS